MTRQFYSLLTNVGKAKLINSQVLGKKLNLTKILVGNGGDKKGKEVFPTEDDIQLVNQCWEGNINRIYVDSDNENYLVVEAVIPEGVGGWYITEFGLLDEEGDLVAIGGYPKTYKPKLTEGSGSSLYLKVMFEVSNAEVVQLKIDPAIVLATQDFVSEKLADHVTEVDPHQQYVTKADDEESKALRSIELARLPIYPEILNEEHRLTITDNGNGSITIDGGQTIRWRGHKDFYTDSYTKEQRTFVINKDKTYHLRWSTTNGFMLKDIASLDYNPEQLDETDQVFDSSFDNMLVACVTNTGGRNTRITTLANAQKLFVQYHKAIAVPSDSRINDHFEYWKTTPVITISKNWGRTGSARVTGFSGLNFSAHNRGAADWSWGTKGNRYQHNLYDCLHKESDGSTWYLEVEA